MNLNILKLLLEHIPSMQLKFYRFLKIEAELPREEGLKYLLLLRVPAKTSECIIKQSIFEFNV